MGYKDTFTYSDQFFVKVDINGKEIRFYPTRASHFADLARISKPMVNALSALFVENGREETATTENMKDAEGTEITKIIVSAITPELAAHKSSERKEAINAIFGCLEDMNNRLIIGKLLMDSMRDEFAYTRDRKPKDVIEWLEGDGDGYEGIDIPTMALLIGGFIKANAKSFGAQGERLVEAVKGKVSALRATSPLATTETASTEDGLPSSKSASSSP